MLSFSLTPRRRETLETLQSLNEQAGDAVHYSVVGARMKISAWTAYGLLRELEKMGLVVRSYALEPGRRLGGRSRILFATTATITAAAQSAGMEEAQAILRAAFERFSAMADEAAAGRAYLALAGTDLGFQLGFWLSRLETAGRGAQEAVRTVIDGTAGPRLKVQALASMGLGSTLTRLQAGTLAAGLTAAAAHFSALLEDAGRASDAQLGALVEAARELQPPSTRRRRLSP